MSAPLSILGGDATRGYMDEALETYYKECACESDASVSPGDDSDDSGRLSPWRAASRGATLCGRASRLTLSHRRTMQQIRDDREGRSEVSPPDATHDSASFAGERHPRTQSLVSLLATDPLPPTRHGATAAATAAAAKDTTSRSVACGTARMYATPQESEQRWRDAERARRRTAFLDTLSAIVQQPSQSCVAPTASAALSDAASDRACRLPGDVGAKRTAPFEGLLHVANMVADAEAELRVFDAITSQAVEHWHFDPTDDVASVRRRRQKLVDGGGGDNAAVRELGLSAFHALARFARALRGVLLEYKVWVVGEQELLVHQMNTSSDTDSVDCLLASLAAAVETNALTLHRMLVVAQDSHCFSDLQARVASLVASRACLIDGFAEACATAGAALLDFLILRASALQGVGGIDLYRLYMMLLMHCAWPYILLVTSVVFGFVRDVDAQLWRRRLPRLFRASFSHLRFGEDRARYPTDILSLLLSCVGYSEFDATAPPERVGRDGCDDGDSADTSPERDHSCQMYTPIKTAAQTMAVAMRHPAAAVAALLSSRRFIVRNADAFARRRRGRGRHSHTLARALLTTQDASIEDRGSGEDEGDSGGPRATTGRVMKDDFSELLRRASAACLNPSTSFSSGQATDPCSADVPLQSQSSPRRVTAHYPTRLPLALVAITVPSHLDADHAAEIGGVACRTSDDEDEEGMRGGGGKEKRGNYMGAVGRARGAVEGMWLLHLHVTGVPDITLDREPGSLVGGVARAAVSASTPWLDITVPAARWITAALLLPIAVVIQRLHRRRLRDLLLGPLSRTVDADSMYASSAEGSGDDDAMLDRPIKQPTARDGAGCARGWLTYQQRRRRTAFGGAVPRPPTSFAFADAVDLLLDVALLRDKERLVQGFLRRLCVEEVHWWYRRDAAELAAVGTTSIAISAAFRDALRGRRYGNLVRLVVLEPAPQLSTISAGDGGDVCDSMTSLAQEMLDVFASMQLVFAFPPELDLVLRPRSLSLDAEGMTGLREESGTCGTVYSSSSTLFWRRRRAVLSRATAGDNAGAASSTSERTESADVWSYAFGYLCALHFAQLTLREQHHALRTRSQQESGLLSVMTMTAGSASPSSRRLRYLARSLGSSYYALSFVVGSVLAFTEREVSMTLARVEQLRTRCDRFVSCIDLCRELDQLLVELWLVCYPVRCVPAAARPTTSPGCCSSCVPPGSAVGVERVRTAINDVLALVLDHTRLPAKKMGMHTSKAAQALVTVLSRLPTGTSLASRLKPLLILLTFNRFYGEGCAVLPMDLSLRSRSSEFTTEELAALAALELPTPRDMTAGQRAERRLGSFTEAQASVQTGASRVPPREKEEVKSTHGLCTACLRHKSGRRGEQLGQLVKVTSCTTTSVASALVSQAVTGSDTKKASHSVPHSPRRDERKSGADGTSRSRGWTRCLYKSFLSRDEQLGGSDETAEALLRVRHVDLVRHQLRDTAPVEIFLNATHVYLSHNNLSDIDGLQLLAHLRVLTVDHNEVVSLRPLAALDELYYLDASHNRIVALQAADDLPCAALRFLDLRHNPCSSSPSAASCMSGTSYVQSLCEVCPLLEELDGRAIATHSVGRLASSHNVVESAVRDTGLPTSRVRSALQHARQTAAASTLSASSLSSSFDAALDTGPQGEAVVSTTDTERQLWQQYVQCAQARRALLHASDKASAGECDVGHVNVAADNTADDGCQEQGSKFIDALPRSCPLLPHLDHDTGSSDEECDTGAQRSREVTQARQMQSRLYADISYASTINHRRLQREVEAHWASVDRIVQTQHGIANARRCRREEMAVQEPSAAYNDAIRVLTQAQGSHATRAVAGTQNGSVA